MGGKGLIPFLLCIRGADFEIQLQILSTDFLNGNVNNERGKTSGNSQMYVEHLRDFSGLVVEAGNLHWVGMLR